MADSNASRNKLTPVRAGLIKGRILKHRANHPEKPMALPFLEALEAASVDDLLWALNLLITRPLTKKRTYRDKRISAIDSKLRQLLKPD